METKVAAVSMRGVTKTFGAVVANEDVDLDIYKGEILALLGENGSGKTTLMNMLSGIYFPDQGQIMINGQNVVIASPKDALNLGIGMVHQHFKLVDVLSATENIILGLEGKLNIKEAAKKIENICNKYGFEVDPKQKIYDMSVSQKQTVEIVKVLYRGADILILDEPTSYLDVKYKLEFLSMLQEMTRKKKIGVLMSLHELDLAERVSDKIVCVKGENIEHYGTPEEVFTDGFVDQLYEITDGTFQEKSGCVELKKCGGIPEVFVIAGNGTGSFLFRQLQRNGIPFAVGILGKNDLDYPAAEALAVQVIAAEAYQDFERQHYEAAKQVMCACRKVICCQTVFGSQNVLNRQLLQEAEDCGMEIELWQK